MSLTLILDGIWGRPWRLRHLQRKLIRSCGPAEIFRYGCSGRVAFEELGAMLAAEIRRRDCPVNLVGFSMGGLVIRAAHMLDPALPIRRVVFLNSPLRGSWLAWALPFTAIRQMRPGSEFLNKLAATPWNIRTLCVWCPLDLMVLPGWYARLGSETESTCCVMPAHIWPIYSPFLHRRVVSFLSASE